MWRSAVVSADGDTGISVCAGAGGQRLDAVHPPSLTEMRPDTVPALLPLGASHVGLVPAVRSPAECALYWRLWKWVEATGTPPTHPHPPQLQGDARAAGDGCLLA